MKKSGLFYYGQAAQSAKTRCKNQAVNLLMPERPSAPYRELPRYNKDLDDYREYEDKEHPVKLTRHHIIPEPQLRLLWNTMVTERFLKGSTTSLFIAMVDLLEENVGINGINLHDVDKKHVIQLLNDIRSDQVTHDPDADTAEGWDSLQEVYAWIPGNIFIGPMAKDRSDDPGEEGFEKNAGVVVGDIKRWKDANEKISKFTGAKTIGNAQNAANKLSEIIKLRKEPFPLNRDNWVLDRNGNEPRYHLRTA